MVEITHLLSVWDTLSEAWKRVKGTKGIFWGAFLLFIFIMFAIGFVQGLLQTTVSHGWVLVYQLVAQVVNYLLAIGLINIGLQRGLDRPIAFNMIFRGFHGSIIGRVIILYILEAFIFMVPMLVIIAGGFIFTTLGAFAHGAFHVSSVPFFISALILSLIGMFGFSFLAVRISLAIAFILDTPRSAMDAIKASFEATGSNFWRILGLLCLQGLIVLVSLIPAGIGIIWSLPLCYITYGVMYKYLTLNVSNNGSVSTSNIAIKT